MSTNLFQGKLLRLAPVDPEADAAKVASWGANTEYQRMLDTDPARPWTLQHVRQFLERQANRQTSFHFLLRTLVDDRLIGFVSLWPASWSSAEGFVGIGIGERDDWGKGYGSDALRLILRYAFYEASLERVSLQAFAYNARGIRAYEKVGFVVEGYEREFARRDGQRWDVVTMGVLRDEWQDELGGTLLAGG